jgi:hypothetical protein
MAKQPETVNRSIPELIKEFESFSTTFAGVHGPAAVLEARTALHLASTVQELTANLNVEGGKLAGRLDRLNDELARSSEQSAKWSKYLVIWTAVLGIGTFVLVLVTALK